MNKDIYTIGTLATGRKDKQMIVLGKPTTNFRVANRRFVQATRLVAAIAADIYEYKKVVLLKNGKKIKAVKIDTIFYQ